MATLTTPRMSLPYPDGTERVMDGDNAIGALANAIDAPLSRAENPLGVAVSGASIVQSGSSSMKLPLDTVLEGLSTMFDNAGDALKTLGGGGGGLYLIHGYGSASIGAVPGNAAAALRLGASGAGGTTFARQQVYFPAITNNYWWSLSSVMFVPDTYWVAMWGECSVNFWPTWKVERFGMVKLGQTWGTAVLTALAALLPQVKPADLEAFEPEIKS